MTTVREALAESILQAGRGSSGDERSAVAILWPDANGAWGDVITSLQDDLEILTLGAYDPDEGAGPAIWIRTSVSGLDEDEDRKAPPVVYMPGVSREQFRRLEDCPEELKPLAELQYRGAFWTQPNGRDWTPGAFLQNPDYGLGIQVKTDLETQKALADTLGIVLGRDVSWLGNRAPIDTATLYEMVEGDPVRTLLIWIGDPTSIDQLSGAEEAAFRNKCRETYGFNVDKDGSIVAAGNLAFAEGAWRTAWRRFREAPGAFPGVAERLRQAASMRQTGLDLGIDHDDPVHAWPQHNEAEEATLRASLTKAASFDRDDLAAEIERLDIAHGVRRSWVWADLGLAPLAKSLVHLRSLADTATPLKQGSIASLRQWYAAEGWRIDDAAIRSFAHLQTAADREAVAGVLAILYTPWADQAARTFQHAVVADPDSYELPEQTTRPNGTCILFTDGLRLDVAHRLAIELRERRYTVDVGTHLAALPTITATAKPALAPRGIEFQGGDGLGPTTNGSTKATARVLRDALNAIGYQTLDAREIGSSAGLGWTEAGSIDSDGHSHGIGLASRLDADVAEIASRIHELLDGGWNSVEVVTDHGFLLMAQPMTKADLPAHLVDLRKGRCARLGPNDEVDYDTVTWRWDQVVRWAIAPGISCFEDGKRYEHGGVSLQECVVPRVTVTRDRTLKPVALKRPTWRGMRMTVEFDGAPAAIDLRTKPGDPDSSLLEQQATLATGQAKAIVANPDVEGTAAVVVALSPSGDLLGQVPTVIGEM